MHRKYHSRRSRAHLAVSTERVLFQTNTGCLCKSISPFTMGLYGSPYDYVIHVALIATSHVSLIISFRPPLGVRGLESDYIVCTFGYVRLYRNVVSASCQ